MPPGRGSHPPRAAPRHPLRLDTVGAVNGANVGVDGHERFAALDKPVLLLSGTTSPAFLRRSTRDLAAVLPAARHVELPGLGHSGPWKAARGGRPATVAAPLRQFFT